MDALKNWTTARSKMSLEEDDDIIGLPPTMISVRTTTTVAKAKFGYRPPPVVTVTDFDEDDIFISIAKSMIYRYEYGDLTAREALDATLKTSEDKRTFLESLDIRKARILGNEKTTQDESFMHELILRISDTFEKELKSMWRESSTSEDDYSAAVIVSSEDGDVVSDDECRPPVVPKTPKAMGFESPKSSSKTKSVTARRRRHFFSDFSLSPNRQRRNKPSMKIIALIPPSPMAAEPVKSFPHSPVRSTKNGELDKPNQM
jgi:hypothetical protein